MRDPIRFGLIGAGGIAQTYLGALQDCSFARLSGVADTREAAAQAAAEMAGCGYYGSYKKLADGAECDAVIVATPPVTHAEIVLYFLDRGIPVLCEKPLTTDLATARKLKRVSEEKGVTLTMASKFRYVKDVIHAKAIVASGILGDIVRIENTFATRVDMSNRWNAERDVSGGGVLMDNGTHSVDIVRYLVGPISEVMAVAGKKVQNVVVEDSASLFARTTCGATALVELAWSYDKGRSTYINIYGTHGTIDVGWQESRFRQSSSPDWVVFGQGYDKMSAFRGQLENFCKNLRGTEPLLITADDAIASVEVIEAAYRSLDDGGWAPVSSVRNAETLSDTGATVKEAV